MSEPITTGHDVLDAALEPLSRLDELELVDQPAVFDAVHNALRSVLLNASKNDEPQTPA